MNYKACLFILTLSFSLQSIVSAQVLPGKRDTIKSAILNERRIIQVILPEKYKPGSADKYDVLYVLDGDTNTKLAADFQYFEEGLGAMPPIIIVGIFNTIRNRDFTPVAMPEFKASGSADKFLAFLKNELIPYINKTYPSDGDNTIFGHSLGGLFVMYALLNDPEVFQSYIAADPSLWWSHRYMDTVAVNKLAGLANLNKTLYTGARGGQPYRGMGILAMDSILKKYAPAGFIWKSQAYMNETHGSVRLKAMPDGLAFTYAGFSPGPVQFYPMNGILLKNKPVTVWVDGDYSNLRYTTDGSQPSVTSPKWSAEISIRAPAKLTVKSFTNRGRYDKTTTGEFKIGGVLPPHSEQGKFKPGGFNYAYYEGEFDKLPNFDKLAPKLTGIADSTFDINKLPRQNNFALLIDGEIEIKENGYYLFGLGSDSGSKLYLGNQLLINFDGLHAGGKVQSYILPLAKGFYPLRLEYSHKDGNPDLKLIYLAPAAMNTQKLVPIPFELQNNRK
jgi:predicted alpha/beta superfamily hydrolase